MNAATPWFIVGYASAFIPLMTASAQSASLGAHEQSVELGAEQAFAEFGVVLKVGPAEFGGQPMGFLVEGQYTDPSGQGAIPVDFIPSTIVAAICPEPMQPRDFLAPTGRDGTQLKVVMRIDCPDGHPPQLALRLYRRQVSPAPMRHRGGQKAPKSQRPSGAQPPPTPSAPLPFDAPFRIDPIGEHGPATEPAASNPVRASTVWELVSTGADVAEWFLPQARAVAGAKWVGKKILLQLGQHGIGYGIEALEASPATEVVRPYHHHGWSFSCKRCGTAWQTSQTKLRGVITCPNPSCGAQARLE
jgi:hypothetical protein